MTASPPLAIWLLALFSVSLSAAAQVLMKLGMSQAKFHGPSDLPLVQAALKTAFDPYVIAGLACYGISAMVWLAVLSRMPLSLAYPLVALAIVMVMVVSAAFLGEPMPIGRIAGSVLVVCGVALIGLKG
jgi:drug/metabolite transporter (DMT)-like permease